LTKPITVREQIYNRLKKLRDEQHLTSFSDVIAKLLDFYEKQDAEINGYLTVKKGEMNREADKILDGKKRQYATWMDEQMLGIEKLVREFVKSTITGSLSEVDQRKLFDGLAKKYLKGEKQEVETET